MKKMNFEQMEGLQGGYKPDGWNWSIEQHILCIASGILVGAGAGGAAAYVLCLALISVSKGYTVVTPDTSVSQQHTIATLQSYH